MQELARREVHDHAHVALLERGREARRPAQHAGADRQHQPALLGLRDERSGGHQAELGVAPAQECLERGRLVLVQHRQVHDLELVPLEGAPQAVEQQHPLERALAHLRREEAVGVLALLLGSVHGEVGVAQQRVGVGAVLGVDADAGARAERHVVVVGAAGPRQAVEQPARDERRVVGARQVLHQYRELVAADAGHQVGAAGAGPQPLGHRLQHDVACGVAQAVVDGLEAVEIEEYQCAAGALAPGARERALERVEEERAVRQPREAVVAREALQVGLGVLPLQEKSEQARDVGECGDPVELALARPLAAHLDHPEHRAPRAHRHRELDARARCGRPLPHGDTLLQAVTRQRVGRGAGRERMRGAR